MGKYIVKRILQVIPMLFILSLIVFMMVRLIPGDPVDMMLGMDIPKDTKEYERERLGLNDPLYIQYFRFVGNALHGDLGTSIFSGKPVVEELAKRFPKTLTLLSAARCSALLWACCWASLRPSTAINSRITSSWFCRS